MHPKREVTISRGYSDVQYLEVPCLDLSGESRPASFREDRIRLDRNDTEAILQIVGGVITMVQADVEDKVRLHRSA
jgi:hypothetical protein